MRTLVLVSILAALSACASAPRDPSTLAYPSQGRQDIDRERREDSVRRMQDEFNQLFPDG